MSEVVLSSLMVCAAGVHGAHGSDECSLSMADAKEISIESAMLPFNLRYKKKNLMVLNFSCFVKFIHR